MWIATKTKQPFREVTLDSLFHDGGEMIRDLLVAVHAEVQVRQEDPTHIVLKKFFSGNPSFEVFPLSVLCSVSSIQPMLTAELFSSLGDGMKLLRVLAVFFLIKGAFWHLAMLPNTSLTITKRVAKNKGPRRTAGESRKTKYNLREPRLESRGSIAPVRGIESPWGGRDSTAFKGSVRGRPHDADWERRETVYTDVDSEVYSSAGSSSIGEDNEELQADLSTINQTWTAIGGLVYCWLNKVKIKQLQSLLATTKVKSCADFRKL